MRLAARSNSSSVYVKGQYEIKSHHAIRISEFQITASLAIIALIYTLLLLNTTYDSLRKICIGNKYQKIIYINYVILITTSDIVSNIIIPLFEEKRTKMASFSLNDVLL